MVVSRWEVLCAGCANVNAISTIIYATLTIFLTPQIQRVVCDSSICKSSAASPILSAIPGLRYSSSRIVHILLEYTFDYSKYVPFELCVLPLSNNVVSLCALWTALTE